MHEIEPYHRWLDLYNPEDDEQSPFYGVERNQLEYSNTVYNYYIHPLWDEFGSRTLYLKVLFADYEQSFVIIEMIGEWNDAVENDIMQLKRSVIDAMIQAGINKFILITENVLNFHSSDDSYYEEWNDDISDDGGWIVMLNLPKHSQQDFKQAHLEHYIFLMEYENWRTHLPQHIFQAIDNSLLRLLL